MKVQGPLLGWTFGLGAVTTLALTVSYGYSLEPGSRLRLATPASDVGSTVMRGIRAPAMIGAPSQARANSGRIRSTGQSD